MWNFLSDLKSKYFWQGFTSVFTFGLIQPKFKKIGTNEELSMAKIWHNTWIAEKVNLVNDYKNGQITLEQFNKATQLANNEILRLERSYKLKGSKNE